MSKIVQAVNSMIMNPYLFSSVTEGGKEIFFIYKNKYKWSMEKRNDGIHLWYYPGNIRFEELVHLGEFGGAFEEVSMIHYHDAEIGTKEARASFSDLYTLVSEKLYGIDDVLDDIISDSDI